jgi:hypothetical protein
LLGRGTRHTQEGSQDEETTDRRGMRPDVHSNTRVDATLSDCPMLSKG